MKMVTALLSTAMVVSSFLSLNAAAAVKVIQVDTTTETCMMGGHATQCLRIREGGSGSQAKKWFLWGGGIENFTHKPGVFYTLRVDERKIVNPAAGQPGVKYRLLEVLAAN